MFLFCLGETDLIKKCEGEDIGLLSGTHVMEGSGRMVVLGVGLNSQVGTIMSLLGATASNKEDKSKKPKKSKEVKPLPTSNASLDFAKQKESSEDGLKSASTTAKQTSDGRLKSVRISDEKNEIIVDNRAHGKHENGGLEDIVEDVDEDVSGTGEGKHQCK